MGIELSGDALNCAIAEALGWKLEHRVDDIRPDEWVSIRPDGSEFILHVIDKYVQAEFETDFPDWTEDAGAALELCLQLARPHNYDVLIRPLLTGEYQATFMRSDCGEFEYWNHDPGMDWCCGAAQEGFELWGTLNIGYREVCILRRPREMGGSGETEGAADLKSADGDIV
jgi:hypothetical protein